MLSEVTALSEDPMLLGRCLYDWWLYTTTVHSQAVECYGGSRVCTHAVHMLYTSLSTHCMAREPTAHPTYTWPDCITDLL